MAASRRPLSAVVVKLSCLAVFLAGIHPAICQAQSVNLKAVHGPFQPFSMERTWAQKVCEAQNKTDESVNVSVRTRMEDSALGKLDFRRDFTLPAQCVRQVTFGVRFGAFEKNAQAETSSKSQLDKFNQTFTLNDSATGRQLSLQQGLLLGVPERTFRIAMLNGTDSDTCGYLKDDPASPFGTVQFLSSGGLDSLPTAWYGYSILDMLMVGAVDDSRLLPSQYTAMERWVRQGGKLLIFAGKGSYEQLQGRLGRLAGVCPVGFHYTDSFNIDGKTYKLASPTYFTELVTDGAEVLETSDTLPLLTAKRTGMGVVMVVASSLSSLKPQDGFNVWKKIADQVKAQHAIVDKNFSSTVSVKETVKVEGPAVAKQPAGKNSKRRAAAGPRYVSKTKDVVPGFATLQEIAGRKAPGRLLPCGILLALVLGTLLLGGLLRIWRRGEMLWMLLLPAVLAVAGVMFYIGQQSRDAARLTNVGYVTALGNGQSHVQEFYAFYSGPTAKTETFGSGCANGIIIPAGKSTLAGMTTQMIGTSGEQMFMPDIVVRPYATSSFFVETVTDYDPMSVSLAFDSSGAVAKIKNNLKLPVENAVLFSNMIAMRVGTIVPGESIVRLTNADMLGEGEFTSSLVQQDTKWNDLISLMLDRGGFHETITAPRILGHLNASPVSPLGKKSRIATQGVSVLDIPVTPSPMKAGAVVNVPAAFLPTDIMNLQTPVWNTATREFNSCTRPSKMIFLVGLPENIRKLKNPSVELQINIQAPGYTMRVARARLIDKGTETTRHKFDAVVSQVYSTVDNPAGVYTVVIPDAGKLPVEKGKMGICIEIQTLKSDIAKTISAINIGGSTNQATWKIVSITPTLKGTVE